MSIAEDSRRSGSRPADFALRWSPLQAMFSLRSARGTPILAYHGIDDAATFEVHLEYLRQSITNP